MLSAWAVAEPVRPWVLGAWASGQGGVVIAAWHCGPGLPPPESPRGWHGCVTATTGGCALTPEKDGVRGAGGGRPQSESRSLSRQLGLGRQEALGPGRVDQGACWEAYPERDRGWSPGAPSPGRGPLGSRLLGGLGIGGTGPGFGPSGGC